MKEIVCGSSDRAKTWGLFLMRVGIGLLFIAHGYPKLIGGPEQWLALGTSMQYFGITFLPTFWGLAAACAEFFGGICLVIGFGTRIASFFLSFTMFVAMVFHVAQGDPFTKYSHPLALLFVFLGLLIAGSGGYSLDALLAEKK